MQFSNTIRNLHLHFLYTGEKESFAVQNEVAGWCREELMQQIDELLMPYEKTETIWQLDTINVELSVVGENWQQQLKERIATELRAKLPSVITSSNSVLREDKQSDGSVLQKQEELLLYYLEHGVLPWWADAASINLKSIAANQLVIWMKQKFETLVYQKFNQRYAPLLIQRLRYLLSSTQFQKFSDWIFTSQPALQIILKAIQLMKDLPELKKQPSAYEAIIQHLLAASMRSVSITNDEAIVFMAYYTKKYELLKSINERINTTKTEEPVKEVLRNVMQQLSLMDTVENEQSFFKSNLISDSSNATEEAQRVNNELLWREGVYVSNAGLVILAAFLPAFFDKLGLLKDNKLQKPGIACNLLALMTGKVASEEHVLLLPKLLCGIEPEVVVAPSHKFSVQQKKEVSNLLSSVIEYWSVLQNTSHEALQETFLLRAGKLSLVKNEWILQVEQKSYDMLLQHLPWNISMIQLPWMQKMLKTEWIY